MAYYYYLGAAAYFIFIIQTIIACFAGDVDVDVDFDGDVDGTGSDILSFKGLIHFLMGFTGWLMLSDSFASTWPAWLQYSIATVFGVVFVGVLYVIYLLCMQLQQTPDSNEGNALVGRTATVYLVPETGGCIITVGGVEHVAQYDHDKPLHKGDVVTIDSYTNGSYHVTNKQ